jgi:hypothetical protein
MKHSQISARMPDVSPQCHLAYSSEVSQDGTPLQCSVFVTNNEQSIDDQHYPEPSSCTTDEYAISRRAKTCFACQKQNYICILKMVLWGNINLSANQYNSKEPQATKSSQLESSLGMTPHRY